MPFNSIDKKGAIVVDVSLKVNHELQTVSDLEEHSVEPKVKFSHSGGPESTTRMENKFNMKGNKGVPFFNHNTYTSSCKLKL